ncbi:MAG: hypothetical protein ACP5QO_05855 [Clostridia bacterium]
MVMHTPYPRLSDPGLGLPVGLHHECPVARCASWLSVRDLAFPLHPPLRRPYRPLFDVANLTHGEAVVDHEGWGARAGDFTRA